MVKLTSKSAAAGLLPLTLGRMQVTEVVDLPLTTLAPYRGHEDAASKALKAAHGMGWPAPNTVTGDGPHAIWFGLQHILLAGAEPDASLMESCAVTDLSGGWAVVDLTGPDAAAALARLTPIDLRDAGFPIGATARTELRHMQASLTRMAGDSYRLMVFRSMAQTLVHDLRIAMETVARLPDALSESDPRPI